MRQKYFFFLILWAGVLTSSASICQAFAVLKPEKIHIADSKKNEFYIKDGLVTGGDQAIDEVIVKDIRHSKKNPGFERLVIDLEGNQNGQPAGIQRPPYYQVSITPDEKRLVFTLWGKPTLTLNAKKIVSDFKKSSAIENLILLPLVEKETWNFVAELKSEYPVEVFELSNPVRVIIDIKLKK